MPAATRRAGGPQPAAGAATPSIIVTQPVRSGQSLIFPRATSPSSARSPRAPKIVAGGSIHVYGTLRGRALAGSMGNAKARIFCRKLEAELVAIDGLYKTAEDIGPGHARHGRPALARRRRDHGGNT